MLVSSYVLTTHIDKGHVHNHLIFCVVDMVNQRKYNSNRQSYAYIRRTSDRLCRENGLSVIQPSRDKGKSYAEWDAGRKGKSWKAKLKAAIDAVIPQAKDFDDFLQLMAAQGYEIKQAAKTINFLTEHGIEQYAELESKVAEISAANDEAAFRREHESQLILYEAAALISQSRR